MYRMLEQASGVTSQSQNLAIGSGIPWHNQVGSTTKGQVLLPDGKIIKDVATDSPFEGTSIPGLYVLGTGNRSDVAAINLSADESRTAPLPIEQLEALGVKLGAVETAEQVRRAKERERQLQVVNGEVPKRQVHAV